MYKPSIGESAQQYAIKKSKNCCFITVGFLKIEKEAYEKTNEKIGIIHWGFAS